MLIISAFIITTLFASCDLSHYPIDDPAITKIDSGLLGKWREKSKKGDKDFITITRLNDYKYSIVDKEKGKKSEAMPAHISVINNARFLNLFIKDSSDEGYMFYRIHNIDSKAGTFSFSTVKDSIIQYLYSPAEVRRYFANRLDDPAFYADTFYMVKMK